MPKYAEIYEFLMSQGDPVELPAPWDFLKPKDASRCPSLAPAALLQALQERFQPAELRATGVTVGADSNPRLNPKLVGSTEPWILWRDGGGRPFDILTANGCLSGQIPALAARHEPNTRPRRVFVVWTTYDVILLRALGVAATLGRGLDKLNLVGLQRLRQLVGCHCSGDLAKESSDDWGTDAWLDLVLVAGSIGALSSEIPPGFMAAVERLHGAECHLGVRWSRLLVWWPSIRDLASFQYRVALRSPALLRQLLTREHRLEYYLLEAFAGPDPPKRRLRPEESYLTALEDLRRLHALAKETQSTYYAQELQSGIKALRAAAEHEIAAPLMEMALTEPDVEIRPLTVTLAHLTGLMHDLLPAVLLHLRERVQSELGHDRELLPPNVFKQFSKVLDQQLRVLQAIQKSRSGRR